MLTYLYTTGYNDEEAPASAQHYMVNGTNMANSQAQATMTTPLSDKELLRHTKMMNNVAVCAIAQKYDIGELKELATAKFRNLLWLEAPNHGLPDIIGAVFETTSTTDPGLRDIAVEYCVRYNTNIVVDDHLCIIIKDYGELGLAVLREVDQHANEDRVQKELLHTQLVQQKKQKELLHTQLVTLKGELAQLLKGNFYGSAAHVEKLNTAYNNIRI